MLQCLDFCKILQIHDFPTYVTFKSKCGRFNDQKRKNAVDLRFLSGLTFPFNFEASKPRNMTSALFENRTEFLTEAATFSLLHSHRILPASFCCLSEMHCKMEEQKMKSLKSCKKSLSTELLGKLASKAWEDVIQVNSWFCRQIDKKLEKRKIKASCPVHLAKIWEFSSVKMFSIVLRSYHTHKI